MNKTKRFHQTGSLASLISGVYEGDQTIANMLQYGNFGLGTINRVDGEVIIDQGQAYICNNKANAQLLSGSEPTPFCVVTQFQHEHQLSLSQCNGITAIDEQLNKLISRPNQMVAIRMEGKFRRIVARSECPQPFPYRQLKDTLPNLQAQYSWDNISGVIVTTYFPHYLKSVNAEGYHHHFISQQQQCGGHVFDAVIEQPVSLQWMIVDGIDMDSIGNKCFDSTDIIAVDPASYDSIETQNETK